MFLNFFLKIEMQINFNTSLLYTNKPFLYSPFIWKVLLINFSFFKISTYSYLQQILNSRFVLAKVTPSFNLYNFNYLVTPQYINFFIINNIDIPVVFNNSHSLRRLSTKLTFIKLINLIMLDGRFLQIKKIVFNSLLLFLIWIKSSFLFNNNKYYSIFKIYTLFQFFFFTIQSDVSQYWVGTPFYNLYNHSLFENNFYPNSAYFLKYFFLTKILAVKPLFLFSVYKINKLIRKYSRGKSGKYTLIWKYIPAYKRTNVTLRWLIKDLKFSTNRLLMERCLETWKSFCFNPKYNYVFKSKRFIHNYVFKNYKKTLLLTLTTTN